MARPRAHAHAASFPFGTAATFLVHGRGFAGDGAHHVSVDLSSADGFTWAPNPAVGTVVNAQWVRVTATPHDNGKRGAGVGDLTITVTNGDGTGASNTCSQDVYYG